MIKLGCSFRFHFKYQTSLREKPTATKLAVYKSLGLGKTLSRYRFDNPAIRPLGLVRILRGFCARSARAPHISTYLGTNTGIYAQIWPYLRDLCPIFGYFVALEIELFVRARTCALNPKAYSYPSAIYQLNNCLIPFSYVKTDGWMTR